MFIVKFMWCVDVEFFVFVCASILFMLFLGCRFSVNIFKCVVNLFLYFIDIVFMLFCLYFLIKFDLSVLNFVSLCDCFVLSIFFGYAFTFFASNGVVRVCIFILFVVFCIVCVNVIFFSVIICVLYLFLFVR